jgi:hypothetical protein
LPSIAHISLHIAPNTDFFCWPDLSTILQARYINPPHSCASSSSGTIKTTKTALQQPRNSNDMSIRTCLTAFMAVLSVANGHMIMNTPTPFGVSTLNNSPLVADGSDFPCKQRSGVYDVEAANNVMPIGVTQTLSFNGSAVHGGGSCQLSLTSDKAPTKDTQWQVIHSIIGGCPANVDGNLPADPNGQGASKFQFSIPSGIAPGDYVLAWTWFNKIGNREMYMNWLVSPVLFLHAPLLI